jgi:tetrahydromethanopterin S-methyltransferase subunit C
VRNLKAVASVIMGLLAIAVLVAGAGAARYVADVGLREAVTAVPVGFLLALVAVSLARRGKFEYQRSLGRVGGGRIAVAGRVLGTVGLIVSLTAALALAVYVVLRVR